MTPTTDAQQQSPVRLLICEDQTLMREGLHTVLALEPGFEVVGEASDGARRCGWPRSFGPTSC